MEDQLVRHIKFPLRFDVQKLQADVRKLLQNDWIAHYNQNDYEGNWNSLSLFSSDGKSATIYAMPSAGLIPTEILADCPYFQQILDGLLFTKTAARLLKLEVGAEIKPHTDNCLGYEDGTFRLHIPVITNPDVHFILDNERLVMGEGECWYINANFTHSVANKGEQDRIHLVIDGERNAWTDRLFFENHSESQFQKPIPKIKDSEKALIIAQLRSLNTDTANELIAKMLAE